MRPDSVQSGVMPLARRQRAAALRRVDFYALGIGSLTRAAWSIESTSSEFQPVALAAGIGGVSVHPLQWEQIGVVRKDLPEGPIPATALCSLLPSVRRLVLIKPCGCASELAASADRVPHPVRQHSSRQIPDLAVHQGLCTHAPKIRAERGCDVSSSRPRRAVDLWPCRSKGGVRRQFSALESSAHASLLPRFTGSEATSGSTVKCQLHPRRMALSSVRRFSHPKKDQRKR